MKQRQLPDSSRLAGLVTTREAEDAGLTANDLRILAANGVLTPIGRGIYAQTDRTGKLNATATGRNALRIAAAVAVAGPQSAGSHESAAIVHGLALLDRPGAVVTLSRPPGAAGRRTARPGTTMHIAALPQRHLTLVGRVPVTSAARTVVDLARVRPFRAGVVVADSALHSAKTTKEELRAVIEDCHRWPGIERARKVIEFADGRAESAFESISRVVFDEGGLPAPDLQVWVGKDDRAGRVDFLWRQYRTIAEADGALKYQDTDRAKLQIARDAELREAGFEVVHFTWKQLMATPDLVIASIRAAFARAELLRSAERLFLPSP
jgi:predicted transcriptional regulator of viral defense system